MSKHLVLLPAGEFWMGSEDDDIQAGDGESPIRRESVSAFRIDAKAVTNSRFAGFVSDTKYVTDAERFGWSFVFNGLFRGAPHAVRGESRSGPWWLAISGASWRAPEGPGSHIGDRQNHPVVHVSWNDAVAYCHWASVRLPTEIEWEYAARGGLDRKRFPWGNELTPGGRHECNIWQGTFPNHNTRADGYLGTAPVDAYRPNGYGLFNVAGNIWEWCADSWCVPRYPGADPLSDDKVLRGGSYLCHESYCNRYRVAARTHNSVASSSGNTGFRVASNV